MGLRLIYGRAGTGKSEKCYKEISEIEIIICSKSRHCLPAARNVCSFAYLYMK